MVNDNIFTFKRKQYLKTWQPIPNIHLPPEQIQYYNHRIQTYGVDIRYPEKVLNEAFTDILNKKCEKHNIDANFLKHLVLLHMGDLINYIENKGVVLEDIEWNIKLILNEIINNDVDENYYINTIKIYEDISEEGPDANIYDLINQAIRLDNRRMLYYLIFKEDENMTDRLSEVINAEVI